MLGRFLHSLNKFCEEEYGLLFDIPDYSVYEFAKVCLGVPSVSYVAERQFVLRGGLNLLFNVLSWAILPGADMELLNG